MKSVKLSLAALGVMALSLFAFKYADDGSIKGTVNPPDAATKAWIMSGADTVQVAIKEGAFEVKNLKAGTYNLIIEAKPPYKSVGKEGITVSDSPVDVGEIKLVQQ